MKELGYMAKDISGTLFNFEWGSGKFEGLFYILDVNGKHLDVADRFEIVEVFHSEAEPIPCKECGYFEDMIATHYEECSLLKIN